MTCGRLLLPGRSRELLRPEERQQLPVDLFSMGPRQAVRPALDHREAATLDGLRRTLSASRERNNPVGVAVDDQCGHVDAREIPSEVGQPGRDAIEGALG